MNLNVGPWAKCNSYQFESNKLGHWAQNTFGPNAKPDIRSSRTIRNQPMTTNETSERQLNELSQHFRISTKEM